MHLYATQHIGAVNVELEQHQSKPTLLTGGMTYIASTFYFTTNFFDTVLYLFDSTGLGIYANDDDPLSPPQSTLGPFSLASTPSNPCKAQLGDDHEIHTHSAHVFNVRKENNYEQEDISICPDSWFYTVSSSCKKLQYL